MIGTRGVPANYGGFETCVEEVGKRLVSMGHDVTVYCRKSYYSDTSKTYLGINRVLLPNIPSKSLDTMSHTFFSTLHAAFGNHDVYMVFNAANSLFVAPLRILGKKIAINTDGLEWKRTKWGPVGRQFYKFSEKIACLVANRLVSDSEGIRDYYLMQHHTDSDKIAYGAPIQSCATTSRIKKMGLEPGRYFLQITRFESENHPLLSIEAFQKLKPKKKFVLVGGNPYPNRYTQAIERAAGDNILLPGFIYDQETLKELWCHCLAYIHGNSVGGTNPALLQAMASGCFTIAIDNPFNRDVLRDCGIYYQKSADSLAKQLDWTVDNQEKLKTYRQKAQARVASHYSWDRIAFQYEELFYRMTRGEFPWRLSRKIYSV